MSHASIARTPQPSAVGVDKEHEERELPEKCQAKFDLGISIVLFRWPALSLAVQNQWGGADSEGKREWFIGAISDMFLERPETDLEDVETTLLQIMLDEFEVNVEDESAYDVAQQVMRLWESTLKQDFSEVDELYASWVAKKGPAPTKFQEVKHEDGDAEDDWDADDLGEGEDEDEDENDVVMSDAFSKAPELVEEIAPEVDADGFTKVMGRRKR